MWEVADDVLLASFAVGDPVAGAVFVRRFQRRVFGLARSIVDDRALAEDLAQEAFVRAWRHAASYDLRRGSVESWLLTIARNVAIDARRARRSGSLRGDVIVTDVERLIGSDGDPARTIERRDEVQRMVLAMRQVPDAQRRALVLAAIGGWTAKEVSDREGIPLGTAKTRIRTGLLALKELLQAERQEELR